MLRLSGAFNSDDILTAVPSVGLPAFNAKSLETSLAARSDNCSIAKPFYHAAIAGHATPREAVACNLISAVELSSMNCYAFVRDPIERYLSAYLYTKGAAANVSAFRRHVASGETLPAIAIPQVDYFYVNGIQLVRPLSFKYFERLLRMLIESVGGVIGNEIPTFKASVMARDKRSALIADWVDNRTRDLLLRRFAGDWQLDRLANEGNRFDHGVFADQSLQS